MSNPNGAAANDENNHSDSSTRQSEIATAATAKIQKRTMRAWCFIHETSPAPEARLCGCGSRSCLMRRSKDQSASIERSPAVLIGSPGGAGAVLECDFQARIC